MFEGLSDKETTKTTTTTTTIPSYRTDESSSYKTDEIENIEQIVRKNENTDIIEISRDIDLKSQLSENFLKITNQLDDWYKLGRSLNAIISEFNDTFIELFEINRVHNKPYPILDYSITIDEEEKIKPDNLETNIRCPDNSENYLKIMYYDRLKSEVKKKLELTDDVLDTDNKNIIESGEWKDVPLNENGANRSLWEKTKERSKGLIGFLGSYSLDGGLKKMVLKTLAAVAPFTISGFLSVPTLIIYFIAALDLGNFTTNKFMSQAKYINEKYSYPKVLFYCEKGEDRDDDEKKTQKGGGSLMVINKSEGSHPQAELEPELRPDEEEAIRIQAIFRGFQARKKLAQAQAPAALAEEGRTWAAAAAADMAERTKAKDAHKPKVLDTPPSEGNKQSQQNGDEEEQPKTGYYSWKKIKNEGEFLKIDENNDENNDDKYHIDKNIIFRKPIFSDNYNKHLDRVEEDLTELFTKPAINKIRSWLNIEEQYYSFKAWLDKNNINKLEKSAANKRKLLQMGGSGSDNDVLSGGILGECNQTASIDSLMKMATKEYPCILEIGGAGKKGTGGQNGSADPVPENPNEPADPSTSNSTEGDKEEIISKLSNYKDKADSEIDPRGFNSLRLKRTEEEFNKDLKRWKLSQFDDIQLINEFKKYKTSVEKGDETSNNKLTKLQKEYIKKFNDRIENIDSKEIPYDPYDFRFLKSINYDNTSFPTIRINDKELSFNDLSNKSNVDNLYHKLRKKYEKKRLDEEEIIEYILTDYGLNFGIIQRIRIDGNLFTEFNDFFSDDRNREYVYLKKEKIDEILSSEVGERDLDNLRERYNVQKSDIDAMDGGGRQTLTLSPNPDPRTEYYDSSTSATESGNQRRKRRTKTTRSTRSTRSKGYLENPIDKLLEVIDNQEGDGFDYKFGSLKDDYKKKKKNIKDIGKYLAVLNDLKLEFEDRKKRVEVQIENDKSNDNKDKYDIKEITKRPNFLDNSYITLFQSVCGIKAVLMWYGDAKDGTKQRYVNETIKDTKVSFNDGVLTMPWQKSLGDGDNKYWEQYIKEILPFFSLTEDKYDNKVKSEILDQNTEGGEESREDPSGDVPPSPHSAEELEPETTLEELEPEPSIQPGGVVSSDLVGGGDKFEIRRKMEPNPQDDIFYNIKLDEQDSLWKEPINKNGIKIDPPLIKLIYLKSNIIDLSKIFYKNAALIEQNLKLYNELNNLIKKSDKDDERDIDEDTNEDNYREMSSDSSTPSDSILSDDKTSVEYIEKEGEDKEPKQERKEEEKIELDKRLYSSSELEDLQKDLERLKLEIKEKELAIKNMNINISRLERLGHGEESEERQRAIKDYEYGQKKLILLNKLVKQRQDRIDNLSELLKEIKNNNSRIISEKYEDNKLQEEINELQLKSRLKETIKNKTDKDNLLYKSLKDSEFKTMEQKLRDIEERENNIKIESIRNDRNNKDDLSNILFKDKVRTPRKRRKKKKNKTLKK